MFGDPLLSDTAPLLGLPDHGLGVHEAEAEPRVEPEAGGIGLPAGVVGQRRRGGRPHHQVLHVTPRQVGAEGYKNEYWSDCAYSA